MAPVQPLNLTAVTALVLIGLDIGTTNLKGCLWRYSSRSCQSRLLT